MKQGGVSDLEIKSIIFSNGQPVFVMGNAKGKMIDPTPIGQIEADLTFQTPSPQLSYLNSTKAKSEATYNMATGEYQFKVYIIK